MMSPRQHSTDLHAAVKRAILARSGTQRGDTITFRCPLDGHEDKHPSAKYTVSKAVWYCQPCKQGGGILKLASMIGLEHLRGEGGVSSPSESVRKFVNLSLTLADLAAAKGIEESFLRSIGVSEITLFGAKAVRILYSNQDGTEGAVRFRRCLEKGVPDERFLWKKGSKLRLYGLNRLPTGGDIWLVEGESDCWTLWQAGEPAVGVPGSGNWNDSRDAEHLERFDRIFAVVEPDIGGETLRKEMLGSRLRDKIHLATFADWGAKDAGELWLRDKDSESFTETLAIAQLAARPVTEVISLNTDKAVREAERIASDLLTAPDIMAVVRQAITAYGYAGDTTPAEIAYVALASTATNDPVNVAFVAASAAGKNAAVDGVRDFFPEDVIYEIEAGSPTTLIYGAEEYQHRAVLYSEADSIPDEGAVASAVRNLAWKKRLVYDVTERNETTGKFQSRRIEKDGPTSLITTSTRSLARQLGTRVFEVPISDDAGQTRKVMLAHAAKVMPGYAMTVDLAPLVAYQQWLRLAGEKRVVIPFATALMRLLPANAVRMRRDAKQILGFIITVAFMHQCTRETTSDGSIIADLADYETVRRILSSTLDTVVTEGVSPAVRETVNAVPGEDEISLSALAKTMNISVSTAQYRVGKALAGGWLVNREERRNRPMRLAGGISLPAEQSAMPTSNDLDCAWHSEVVDDVTNESRGDTDPPPPPEPTRQPDPVKAAFSANGHDPVMPFDLVPCQGCGAPLPDDRNALCRACGDDDDDYQMFLLGAPAAPSNVLPIQPCVHCGQPAMPGRYHCARQFDGAKPDLAPTGTDGWEVIE
jgi:hypothetical protein